MRTSPTAKCCPSRAASCRRSWQSLQSGCVPPLPRSRRRAPDTHRTPHSALTRRCALDQELRSLEQRTRGRAGASLACTCLVAVPADEPAHHAGADSDGAALLGCLDVSWKTGPCGSSINGQCVAEGEEFCYIDNVCVAAGARRAGVASALLAAASSAAAAYGGECVLTHVHVANEGARALYAQWGFHAPPLDGSRQESFARASDRMRGLLLLRAPLPLQRAPARARRRLLRTPDAHAAPCCCGGAEWGLVCVCPAA